MTEIIKFKKIETEVEKVIDEDFINSLKGILKAAEKGEIDGMASVILYNDDSGSVGLHLAGTASEDLHRANSGCVLLQYKIKGFFDFDEEEIN